MPSNGVRDGAWHNALWADHREGIMVMLVRRLRGDTAAAEDVTQETFKTAWTKRQAVPDEPRAWLYKVALNHLKNHGRKARRNNHMEYNPETMAARSVTAAADAHIGANELDPDGKLASLTKKEREILELRYIDELDYDEIVVVLGITAATARQRLFRAQKKVEKLLGRQVPDTTERTHADY